MMLFRYCVTPLKSPAPWVCGLVVLLASGAWARPAEPVSSTAEARRAFDDLRGFYNSWGQKVPPYSEAIRALSSREASQSSAASAYVLALFRQSLADETNGRSGLGGVPDRSGSEELTSRNLRLAIEDSLLNDPAAAGEGAVDPVLWIVEEERVPERPVAAFDFLARMPGQPTDELLKRLVERPHPNPGVVVAALGAIAQRRAMERAADVIRLCGHYRAPIRDAARAAARQLGLEEPPAFNPAEGFSPWLEEQLRALLSAVIEEIPPEATWSHFKVQVRGFPDGMEYSGWLLREDGEHLVIIDWMGSRRRLPKGRTTVEAGVLADELRRMCPPVKETEPEKPGLRRETMCVPGQLMTAWCWARGDKATAAEVLFPRIERSADDRWLDRMGVASVGHAMAQVMQEAYCYERDYGAVAEIARHLTRPVFGEGPVNAEARVLLPQVSRHSEDFKEFRFPTSEEWKHLQGGLNRPARIAFLAERLRLLNCIQNCSPGDVSYEDDQHAESFQALNDVGHGVKREALVNPYSELLGMGLTPEELRTLVPLLESEEFVPSLGYHRHGGQWLVRLWWVVARLVNTVAGEELIKEQWRGDETAANRHAHAEKVREWCRAHAGQDRSAILLQVVRQGKDEGDVLQAAEELILGGDTDVEAALTARLEAPGYRLAGYARLLWLLNSPKQLGRAREWVRDPDNPDLRFWAALILLRHGDRTVPEGLDVLADVLKDDKGSWGRDRASLMNAIPDLVATGNEKALAFACSIFDREWFVPRWGDEVGVVQTLFLAGRSEASDYLLKMLEPLEYDGEFNFGDDVPQVVSRWSGISYDRQASLEDRRKACDRMKGWVRDQFGRIQRGEKAEFHDQSGK